MLDGGEVGKTAAQHPAAMLAAWSRWEREEGVLISFTDSIGLVVQTLDFIRFIAEEV